MTGRIPTRAAKLAAALLAVTAILAVATGTASAAIQYNNIPKTLPGNFASLGFDCCQTSEFGGQVGFASIQRKNPTVTVVMSTWACEKGVWTWPTSGSLCVTKAGAKFKWPITLNIYAVGTGNSVGALLKTETKEFEMPFRPTASAKCSAKGEPGKWYQGTTGKCFNGKAFEIKFAKVPVILPGEKAIITVAYNTTGYGAVPQGPQPCNQDTSPEAPGCPYDSLNVAVHQPGEPGNAPSVGTNPDPEEVYISSTSSAYFCPPQGPGPSLGQSGGGCLAGWMEEQPVMEVSGASL
jgi:hypothetical protein